MSDIRDILEIEPSRSDISKESIIGVEKKSKMKNVSGVKLSKRPEGMAREVFALLYNDKKDAPPLFPTDTGQGYKNAKAKLGMKSVRPWRWTPFTNPARNDNAVFHHWRRASDEPKDYPFAKFNKEVQVPTYTDADYATHLSNENWTKDETDHLFDLCKRFDLRFVVMHDRWDRTKFRQRSIEDLKERYYSCVSALSKVKTGSGLSDDMKTYVFDAEHEKKRKEQLQRLYNRTKEQVEEEHMLQSEYRKIEMRKKERDKKTQEFFKLITAQEETKSRVEKKSHKKKTAPKLETTELSNIKFPDTKNIGVMIRSHRMKLPGSIGQKKTKALEKQLEEYKIESNPIPTEEICQHFNEFRSDLLLANELSTALSTCLFEIETLRHQYEATNPGKTLQIPKRLCEDREKHEEVKSEDIDVVGSDA